jgi:hypothetical protein
VLTSIAKGLRKQLTKQSCGSFFCIRFIGGNFDCPVWFCAGYTRLSNPAVTMILPACIDMSTGRVSIDASSGLEEMLVDVTFMGRVLHKDWCLSVQRATVSSAPVDDSVRPVSASCVQLVADWRVQLFNNEQTIYPLLKGSGKKISTAVKRMRDGVKSVGEHQASVKIKFPKPAGPKAHMMTAVGSGSEEEWDDLGSDSSLPLDEESDPDDPVPDIALPGGPVKPAHVGDAERFRENRMIPFGPWSISEYYSGGKHVGYGANCGCHRNKKDTKTDLCKKVFTFAGESVVATRCLAKSWLLMGLDIGDAGDARKAHVLDIRRGMVPRLSEDELDRRAAALL